MVRGVGLDVRERGHHGPRHVASGSEKTVRAHPSFGHGTIVQFTSLRLTRPTYVLIASIGRALPTRA